MNDLEITKLCAEAMVGIVTHELPLGHKGAGWIRLDGKIFSPLHDDAQAMSLVKRFALAVMPNYDRAWNVSGGGVVADNADLNRAICECVANMQQAKGDK